MSALQLRPAQVAGAEFLAANPKAFLCLRMRMGKSAVALQQCEPGKTTLIVCPVIVKTHWVREIHQWRPDLGPVQVMHRKTARVEGRPDVIIVPYSILFDLLATGALPRPDYLVVDESHYAKDAKTHRVKGANGKSTKLRGNKRTRAVCHLIASTPRAVCLTGTPIPNRPIELFMLLNALGEPEAKVYTPFARKFADGHMGHWGWDDTGASNLPELKELLGKWMFHSQGGHIPVKPTVIEMDVTIDKAERDLLKMDQINWSNPQIPFEALSEIRRMSGERKVKQAVEYIRDCLVDMEKVVVFAWHSSVIDGLAEELSNEFGVAVVDGRTSDRQDQVDRFQTDPGCRVFIGQIIAAGVGISLAAADHVVFVENDWVPGNMDQALARVETGDDQATGRVVTADILVSMGGIDSKVIHSVIKKMAVINSSLNEDFIEGNVA